MARPRCLYCGADLPPGETAAADRPAAAAPGEAEAPRPDRVLLVLDLQGTDPDRLGKALGLPAFEAAQRALRGGYQLHRLVPPEEAAREAARLAEEGLTVWAVPEAEARSGARPLLARGGEWAEGALRLRLEEGEARVDREDLLIVVRGPITREYQPEAKQKKVSTATPAPGYRFHLHRRSEPRPVELDPDDFRFGPALGGGSSLLQLSDWVEALQAGVPEDDCFRRIPPALAPAASGQGGLAALLEASARPGDKPREGEAVVLDNLEQFRFYSAWRAAVERRVARLSPLTAPHRGEAS